MRPEILDLSDKLFNYLRRHPASKLWQPANKPVDGLVTTHANGGPTVMIEFIDDTDNKNACSLAHFMLVNNLKTEDLD